VRDRNQEKRGRALLAGKCRSLTGQLLQEHLLTTDSANHPQKGRPGLDEPIRVPVTSPSSSALRTYAQRYCAGIIDDLDQLATRKTNK
jgi:hypothetical protein